MSEILDKIKNEVAKDFGYNSYSELFDKKELSDSIIDAVATRYATEVAKNIVTDFNKAVTEIIMNPPFNLEHAQHSIACEKLSELRNSILNTEIRL